MRHIRRTSTTTTDRLDCFNPPLRQPESSDRADAQPTGARPPGARRAPRRHAAPVADRRARRLRLRAQFSQEQVLERLGLKGDEFAEGIFARCGVKRRHLDLSEDFLGETLQGRAEQIEQELLRHSIHAVDALGSTPSRSARSSARACTRSAAPRSPTGWSTTTGWIRRPTSTTSAAWAARAACR